MTNNGLKYQGDLAGTSKTKTMYHTSGVVPRCAGYLPLPKPQLPFTGKILPFADNSQKYLTSQ